ncbi:DUF4147 domain-containing protein [Candidatus Kaiserbacteria bacterium]|nr:DUF4147 domain-containing protein [Candidatus Kaiserbacteria bacterium]
MKRIIKNFDSLATTALRRAGLTIAEAGLQAIDTERVLRDALQIKDDHLMVGGHVFDLSTYQSIYVVGFGKVACTAAYAIEQILAGKVREGAVIGVSGRVCEVVDTYTGTHPLPSPQNYTATKHIMEVAARAKKDDLVIVVVSGGGSALLCSSMSECEQGSALFESFLRSGGTIEELNVVRKHISKLKGGGLAEQLYPATVLSLIFSDVPGGELSAVASGPTYLDTTTSEDAKRIIDTYQLGSFALNETPKDQKYFERVYNVPVVTNMTALEAMQKKADELGYSASIVSATQYATIEETKELLLSESSEGKLLVMGGETKLTVPAGSAGAGGRNCQLALSVLPDINEQQLFISLASDGHDNSPAAGALADVSLRNVATLSGLSIEQYTEAYDSYSFFSAVAGQIETGVLESNVSDLMLLVTANTASTTSAITDVTAAVVLDSRGAATISVTVHCGEHTGVFSVPSGASTGTHEVVALPAKKAVAIITKKIAPALRGMRIGDQSAIDARLHELDGTANFSNIGGNVALGVSAACTVAAAASYGIPVWQHIADLFGHKSQAIAPRLFVNVINGGKHATYGSAIQEHQIIVDTDDVAAAFTTVKNIHRALYDELSKHYPAKKITLGDEGGYVIPSTTIEEPFIHLQAAIAAAQPTVPVWLGADIAASSFYAHNQYALEPKTKLPVTGLLERYRALHTAIPNLKTVEDPFHEQDFSAFAAYKHEHPDVLVIGDDLTTTSVVRLEEAIAAQSINALIIKPNQIGTVTDTLRTMELAYANNIQCIVSHRSGETEDTFIADLAFGTKAFGLKAGAPSRPERVAKYNRLLAIYKQQ